MLKRTIQALYTSEPYKKGDDVGDDVKNDAKDNNEGDGKADVPRGGKGENSAEVGQNMSKCGKKPALTEYINATESSPDLRWRGIRG